jgi:hypothetical protein
MDILDFIRKVNAIGKYFVVAVLMLNLMSLVVAGGAETNIKKALSGLCVLSQTFLGAASMVLIVSARCSVQRQGPGLRCGRQRCSQVLSSVS